MVRHGPVNGERLVEIDESSSSRRLLERYENIHFRPAIRVAVGAAVELWVAVDLRII